VKLFRYACLYDNNYGGWNKSKKINKTSGKYIIALVVFVLLFFGINRIYKNCIVPRVVNKNYSSFLKSLVSADDDTKNDFINSIETSYIKDIYLDNDVLYFELNTENYGNEIPKNKNSQPILNFLTDKLNQLIIFDYITVITVCSIFVCKINKSFCIRLIISSVILCVIEILLPIVALILYAFSWKFGNGFICLLSLICVMICIFSLSKSLINNETA
jgi:hypothetical protein